MRVMCAKVLARSAKEGSGTTGWSLAVPVRACCLADKEDILLQGSLNNRGVVVYQAKTRAHCRKSLQSYTIISLSKSRGGTNGKSSGTVVLCIGIESNEKDFGG